MGDITGDRSSKRGQVSGSANGAMGAMIIQAMAPLSELAGYQSRLNAMTSGQGRYTIALSHYEAVPANTHCTGRSRSNNGAISSISRYSRSR